MAVTGSFITYGTGQIISGILGDKISPKRLVSLGFILTIVMNLLIPVCQNPYQMLIVWCINGFAQSFMWPPLVKLMTAYLSDDDYKKASVKISWGSSFGTIFVYLCAPPLISLGGWKTVFLFSAVAGTVRYGSAGRVFSNGTDHTHPSSHLCLFPPGGISCKIPS
jgi:OPA family glycerol-3-phosphate transporter-like MFS transporter